ncbi:MAG TPA: iron-containing alcohol dehydrogenase [Syntrophales bacterium]|nr:iron-containing alcohol dehydrogenase [Syntrophales bacterium]HOX94326.1 iron-containing alcohol dehydrogenase [Syntrophales bacterium]HPI56179.1 iron-containing alcohol dehydrogenase [Syntrophales bacterium]HPN24367.1 iron-containing alcohol dehydrogenase [Syntrophales bacterium]HQM28997.1 iron-containing alcohol dehydrogenase [Syntrophales bacterium]
MQNFVFENPTRVIFGKGSIARIGQELKRFGSKALMVYGSGSIKKNGVYDQVAASLKEAQVPHVEFAGVRSNPYLSKVLEGIEVAKKEQVDVILAVGGGSVIDTAKTIACGVKADHDIWDFFTYKKPIRGALPVLTILTISASASEMNPAAVITKEETCQKFSIRSPFIQPKVSIMDPSALFTLSDAYTAYSAADTVTHMLEGYFNNTEPSGILQDRLVESLMRTLMEATEVCLKNPADYNARANFMWSATLGFNGLTTAGMGIVGYPAHMIEHSLSALYDVPHGAGLSIVLPAWMTWASRKNPAKFARLAREVFGVKIKDDVKAAARGISKLKSWFASIKTPVKLREVNIPRKDIGKIAENAVMLAETWKLSGYTKEVITDILKLCR